MSTGAWIFTGLVSAAIIAPTAVYAAASSTVAIGNTTNNTTANLTTNHQLLTTTIAPKDVITADGGAGAGCGDVYSPPAGKAIVVTSVTYDMFGNAAGAENFAILTTVGCSTGRVYDVADTQQADQTEIHTFPIGLPMASAALDSFAGTGSVYATITGYLIPAGQLPATGPATKVPARKSHPAP